MVAVIILTQCIVSLKCIIPVTGSLVGLMYVELVLVTKCTCTVHVHVED